MRDKSANKKYLIHILNTGGIFVKRRIKNNCNIINREFLFNCNEVKKAKIAREKHHMTID